MDEDNRSRVVGAGGIAALVPLYTGSNGGQTERQKAFAHACLSNLAIDKFIKAKIEAVASSGSETARNREFVSACWSKGQMEEAEDARMQAEIDKLEALKLGNDGGMGGESKAPTAAAPAVVDVQ